MMPGNGMRPGMIELAEQHAEALRRNAPPRRAATDHAASRRRRAVRTAVGRALVRAGERLAAPACAASQ